MKEHYQTGYFVKSLAGHDKEKVYVIVKEEKDYVYVADGISHLIDKPKKKNKKHIQWININIIENEETSLDNVKIHNAIKSYKTVGGF